jgi:hypothetical protein
MLISESVLYSEKSSGISGRDNHHNLITSLENIIPNKLSLL